MKQEENYKKNPQRAIANEAYGNSYVFPAIGKQVANTFKSLIGNYGHCVRHNLRIRCMKNFNAN